MHARIMRISFLALWALLLAPLGWLHAQSLAPKTYAVLVGIDRYADAKIKPRRHALADVKSLYEVIVSRDYLGADPKNVHLLLDKKGEKDGPATRANILAALDAVVADAQAGDLVLFAFFGQGCPLGEHVGFFGTDGSVAQRAKTALDGADIAKKLEGLKTQQFCAFIDINLNEFDNAKAAVRELDLRSLGSIVLGNQDLPPTKRPKGRVMFIASNGLTPTVQLEKHSLFGQAIVDGLKGAADTEGYEPDGAVTVTELAKYLEKELPRVARTVGKSKDEKGQQALVLRNPPTYFTISRTPVAGKTTEKRLGQFSKLAKNGGVSKEVASEGQRLLFAMPLVKYQQELRKHYQKLADGALDVPDFLKVRAQIVEESKLARADALAYANRMHRALDLVTKTYFRRLDEGDLAAGAVRALYDAAHEPIPTDLAERLNGAKGLSPNQIVTLLADARESLRNREDLENRKADEATIKYVFSHQLDKYSYYVDADVVRRFQADTSGKYTGVGIQVRRDPVRNLLLVVTPIRGGPAHKAGVQAGDYIATIKRDQDSDGNPLDKTEVIPGDSLPLDEAIKKIVGRPGTKVRLAFEREGSPKLIEIELTRASIVTESVFGVKRNKDASWTFHLDADKKIGYVRLSHFTDTTHLELERAVDSLTRDGMKGLILDLRFNPGGKLNTALQVGGLFIKNETIVSVRRRGAPEQRFVGMRVNNDRDFPLAVLINRNSASASELVSACWQDHKRAVIIGDRSFGKGTVVTSFPFAPTSGILVVTTATFWRPSGKNLEKITTAGREDETWGVVPNEGYRIKLGRHEEADLLDHLRRKEIITNPNRVAKDDTPAFRDVQLEKAVEYVRQATK
ncbi:MAG: S41 family peptidase [Planctomycetes bacterium]|nr:S41 family peptidase [Planctomycetota bacterium]